MCLSGCGSRRAHIRSQSKARGLAGPFCWRPSKASEVRKIEVLQQAHRLTMYRVLITNIHACEEVRRHSLVDVAALIAGQGHAKHFYLRALAPHANSAALRVEARPVCLDFAPATFTFSKGGMDINRPAARRAVVYRYAVVWRE